MKNTLLILGLSTTALFGQVTTNLYFVTPQLLSNYVRGAFSPSRFDTNTYPFSMTNVPTAVITNLNFSAAQFLVTDGTNIFIADSAPMTNIVHYGLFKMEYNQNGDDSTYSIVIGSTATNIAVVDEPGVSIGYSAESKGKGIAVGYNATGTEGSAIGYGALAGRSSIAVGEDAQAGTNSVVVGYQSVAGNSAIVMGYSATAQATNAIAIGHDAQADYTNSVVIGHNATATQANDFVLGNASHQVRIPGEANISGAAYVGGDTILAGFLDVTSEATFQDGIVLDTVKFNNVTTSPIPAANQTILWSSNGVLIATCYDGSTYTTNQIAP